MSDLTIRTNHQWRQFTYRSEVPDKVLADQFDHLDEDEGFDGFFCYRGIWYHLSDFMRVGYPGPFGQTAMGGWHGYASDSFFSGVLIKVSEDGEEFQVATYFS